MAKTKLIAALSVIGSAAIAEDLHLSCAGEAPDWTLELMGQQAEFTFPAPTQLDVPHVAVAENRAWPRAMTLIGDRDSAIAIIDQRACGAAPNTSTYSAQVLTQRGQTPIFLVGCCTETQP